MIPKDKALIIAMLDLHRSVKGPAKEVIDIWLVNRAKHMWPRFAGLSFFKKTNVDYSWRLISVHHPAQLCWSWGWSISFRRGDIRGRKIGFPMRYHKAWITIPFVCCIRYHRQPYDYMLSSAAERRLREYAFEGVEA